MRKARTPTADGVNIKIHKKLKHTLPAGSSAPFRPQGGVLLVLYFFRGALDLATFITPIVPVL